MNAGDWKLFGLGGSLLAKGKFASPKFSLEFDALPAGCYFLRLEGEDGEYLVEKWIKE
jgi:hypothetical protein